MCNIPAPVTGLEAKFSLRLTTAMGIAGVDTGRLSTYSEAVAADPTLVRLRDKLEFDFRKDQPITLAELELLLTDGRHVTAQVGQRAFPPPTSPRRASGWWRSSTRWSIRCWERTGRQS